MRSPPLIFGIIPVHNRREITLRCLRHLRATGVLTWLQVCVVDDGSVDGTGAAIQAEFPEIVLLTGNGDLWWTGSIVLGMRQAMTRGADWIVWLNDDSLPEPGALATLVETSRDRQAMAGGVCFLPGEERPAYGGFHKDWCRLSPMITPKDNTIACDALSGNLVCFPCSLVERIGYPDAAHLPHGFADIDYAMRARAAGTPVLLVGTARGHGQPNLSLNYRSWLLSDVPLTEWWQQLYRRGSFMYQPAQWRFYWRHWGLDGAAYCAWGLLKLAGISALRLLLPLTLLRRIHGHRSTAWQHEQAHRQRPADR